MGIIDAFKKNLSGYFINKADEQTLRVAAEIKSGSRNLGRTVGTAD